MAREQGAGSGRLHLDQHRNLPRMIVFLIALAVIAGLYGLGAYIGISIGMRQREPKLKAKWIDTTLFNEQDKTELKDLF